MVFTPEEAGAVSSEFDDARHGRGFRQHRIRRLVRRGLSGVCGRTCRHPRPSSRELAGSSFVPIVIGVGIVGLVGSGFWRGSRKSKAAEREPSRRGADGDS